MRTGLRHMLLVDDVKVQPADLAGPVYRHDDLSTARTQALSSTLSQINAECSIEQLDSNVADEEGGNALRDKLTDATGALRVQLLLMCVDNQDAQHSVNRLCLDLELPWLLATIATDAISGTAQAPSCRSKHRSSCTVRITSDRLAYPGSNS
jgi:molybdopterin/thiamine biosynthesis adenylyltransferase